MDCKVFRKRLTDFIEDNISHDLKNAMLDHIAECEECRVIYEEELSLDETIRRGLSIDPRSFTSSRAEIMKSIDKNKYGTSPMKRFINHLRKYRGTYTSVAAIVAAAIFITPYISKNGLGFAAKKSESMDNSNASIARALPENASGTAELKMAAPEVQSKAEDTKGIKDSSLAKESAAAFEVNFEKNVLDKSYSPSFNTAWKNSPNKKYRASLEGRGDSAGEEGVATIVVKSAQTGEQWSFTLTGNEMMQMSPRSVHWVDDQNLLVVVGLAQGHASLGGNLYMLNIDSSQTVFADPENKANLQNGSVVMGIESTKILADKQLEITAVVAVYDDDIYNKYHMENRVIVIPYDGN